MRIVNHCPLSIIHCPLSIINYPMIKIVSPFLIKFLTRNFARAITLFPFVIFKDKIHLNDFVLINHERIHIHQQIECLIVIFYVIYLLEYIMGRIQGKSHDEAYRAIRFEKEAYANEANQEYVINRPWFGWMKY